MEVCRLLDQFSESVPRDFTYLLHHSYHWIGRTNYQIQNYDLALTYFKKVIIYKNCEFSLETKTQQLIQQIQAQKKTDKQPK